MSNTADQDHAAAFTAWTTFHCVAARVRCACVPGRLAGSSGGARAAADFRHFRQRGRRRHRGSHLGCLRRGGHRGATRWNSSGPAGCVRTQIPSGGRPPLALAIRHTFDRRRARHCCRLGPRDSDVATDEAGFARVLHLKGDYRAAEALYRRSIETHRLTRRAGHPRTAGALLGLGELLLERGDAAGAEPHLREALRSFSTHFPAGHPAVVSAQLALGECLTKTGSYGEAEPLLLETLTTLTAVRGERDAQVRRARRAVADLYDRSGRQAQAARFRSMP